MVSVGYNNVSGGRYGGGSAARTVGGLRVVEEPLHGAPQTLARVLGEQLVALVAGLLLDVECQPGAVEARDEYRSRRGERSAVHLHYVVQLSAAAHELQLPRLARRGGE